MQARSSGESLHLQAASEAAYSQDAIGLFAKAKLWAYSEQYFVEKFEPYHTNSGNRAEGSSFKVAVVSSTQIINLYKHRRLKGSVLVAGLEEDIQAQDIPASAWRTLSHLLELQKSGYTYVPFSTAAMQHGFAASHYAPPLWTIHPSAQNQKEGQQGSTSAESLAIKVLQSCQSWCYLYSHDGGNLQPMKAKKTPPKTAQHMIEMYRSGCLPEWTPLLGLQEEVAHFNSLPPSLFVTLGALMTVIKAGYELQPVGVTELQRYDKFIETRNHIGATIRTPSQERLVAASNGATSRSGSISSQPMPPSQDTHRTSGNAPPHVPRRKSSVAISTTSEDSAFAQGQHAVQTSGGGGGGGGPRVPKPEQQVPQYVGAPHMQPMVQFHGIPTSPPAMYPYIWGMPQQFAYVPGPPVPPPAPAQPVPNHPHVISNGLSAGPSQAARKPSNVAGPKVRPGRLPSDAAQDAPQQDEGRVSGVAKPGFANPSTMHPEAAAATTPAALTSPTAASVASPWGPWTPYMHGPPPPCLWTTPLFRLFVADSSRGQGMPVWWYLDSQAPGGMVGPVGCEAMILSYASGALTNQHMVCGTHADVTAMCPPSPDFFENLGALLQQIAEGGDYSLVSLTEVLHHVPSSVQSPAVAHTHVHHGVGPYVMHHSSGSYGPSQIVAGDVQQGAAGFGPHATSNANSNGFAQRNSTSTLHQHPRQYQSVSVTPPQRPSMVLRPMNYRHGSSSPSMREGMMARPINTRSDPKLGMKHTGKQAEPVTDNPPPPPASRVAVPVVAARTVRPHANQSQPLQPHTSYPAPALQTQVSKDGSDLSKAPSRTSTDLTTTIIKQPSYNAAQPLLKTSPRVGEDAALAANHPTSSPAADIYNVAQA